MTTASILRNADETRPVSAGTTIVEQGTDAGDEMYGIISGRVELHVNGTLLVSLGPDEIFGELALIDSSPHMATAVAVEDTELAVISRQRFLFLVTETPMFALNVMHVMADRLRSTAP